jgi:hypothetical protein
MHDADQKCILGDRPADVVGIDQAGVVDPHIGDLGAQALQKAARFHGRRVLDPGGNHMRRTITASDKPA